MPIRRATSRLASDGKIMTSYLSHMLKNSFYCGIITYHKEYTPDYLKQKKIKNYGDIEYLTVKGKHTPIVTEEEFNQVQKIMNAKSRKMKNLTSLFLDIICLVDAISA